MTKRIIKITSLLSMLILLTACGQKGPLYMPPERETTQPPQPIELAPDEASVERASYVVIEGSHDPV